MSDDTEKNEFSKKFGLVPIDGGFKAPVTTAPPSADYDYARNNIYQISEIVLGALGRLTEVADQSQHPRAYEALTALATVALQNQKDLLELQKLQKELNDGEGVVQPAESTQTNIFVGSTAELQNMIKGLKAPE